MTPRAFIILIQMRQTKKDRASFESSKLTEPLRTQRKLELSPTKNAHPHLVLHVFCGTQASKEHLRIYGHHGSLRNLSHSCWIEILINLCSGVRVGRQKFTPAYQKEPVRVHCQCGCGLFPLQ